MSDSDRARPWLHVLTAMGAVAACLWLAWAWREGLARSAAGHFGHDVAEPTDSRECPNSARGSFEADCQQVRRHFSGLLGQGFAAIVRPPFAVAGDAAEEELDRWHRETIAPAAAAMEAVYFNRPPDVPIAVVLYGDQATYQREAKRLLGRDEVSPHGHYRPHLRMIVVSTARGGGPLRHELTHALLAFDWPNAPAWLAEGLAALNERCRVSADPPAIEGLAGPRLEVLQEAIREDRLRPLGDLMSTNGFAEGRPALNYAHAWGLCLYLQERGALAEFYRRFRDARGEDPSGEKSLRAVLGGGSLLEIEAGFRRFVRELRPCEETGAGDLPRDHGRP